MKLTLSNAKKSYGAHDVLIKAAIQVRDSEKIALVGRNGCGKTTLLKILCGQESMDEGNLTIASGTQIGYLAQVTFSSEEHTVYEELLQAFDHVRELEDQLNKQAAIMADDPSEKEIERYAALQQRFEALNGYQYDVELKSVFFHFQFDEQDLNRPLKEFSSGQKTRIALVKLLLSKPDILLLDEPTNHLDIDAIEWLENYIRHYPSAVILVSHDRMFLDRVADEIVEIEFGRTTRYVGNYSQYIKAKEEYLLKNHDAYLRQQADIKRLEELIDKFRYKRSKAAFAQSKIKYLERMERIEDSRQDTSRMKAHFICARKGGKHVLEANDLVVGYDIPLSTVSFELIRNQRMAVYGSNGIGKSTLMKTLVEKIPPLAGSYTYGHQIDVGYFDQDSAQMTSDNNVLEELWQVAPDATQTEIRNTLASFLFTKDEVFKEMNSLSGGERVRLALAKLMLEHGNLLLLDEPTNHLDIPTKEALEDALQDYDGTILFVSHDRMFLKKMATRILEISDESKVYDLTYDEYIEKKKADLLTDAVPEPNQQSSVNDFQDRKVLKNRIARLEVLLDEAQKELDTMQELRYEPEYYESYQKMDELEEQISQKEKEIETLMEEWEEKMEAMES